MKIEKEKYKIFIISKLFFLLFAMQTVQKIIFVWLFMNDANDKSGSRHTPNRQTVSPDLIRLISNFNMQVFSCVIIV